MMALMMEHEDPRFAHPFYWAPFVIVGEGGVPDPARSVQ
jgi:CHAT domain-containing protein